LENFLGRPLALPADIVEKLEARLGDAEGEPHRLDGGITNHIFRACFGGREVVVRLPGNETGLLGADRVAEREANERAATAGVAAPLVFASEEPEMLVTEYVVGETMSEDEGQLREPTALAEVATMLRAVHACAPIAARFDCFRLVERYAATTRERGGEVPATYEEAGRAAARIEAVVTGREPPVLCHNDLLAANFLRGRAGLRLIDWEYAGMGERWFDLGNFVTNNKLDREEEAAFLRAYLGAEPGPAELATLALMRLMSDFREAMWAVVQDTVSDLDVDFAAHADAHFERLLAVARDPSFERHLEDAGAAR
jgi:thiamine kinase-like enzyme